MFINRVLPSFLPLSPGCELSEVCIMETAHEPFTASMSFSNTERYHFLCMSVNPT